MPTLTIGENMHIELYEKITDALVHDGYVIIENSIDVSLAHNLLSSAKKSKNFKRAGISARKKINPDKRRDKILWMTNDGAYESEFLSICDGLQNYLNRELFMGITYFESHFALYEKGDFYETHYDAFKNSVNRVVSLIYYLNENWKQTSDGGELIIYDENENLVKKVLPESNTLVVFLSEKFPHEVLKAKRKRYSIAGWFRVDKI